MSLPTCIDTLDLYIDTYWWQHVSVLYQYSLYHPKPIREAQDDSYRLLDFGLNTSLIPSCMHSKSKSYVLQIQISRGGCIHVHQMCFVFVFIIHCLYVFEQTVIFQILTYADVQCTSVHFLKMLICKLNGFMIKKNFQ